MMLGKTLEFYVAVAVAILVKIRTSERLTIWQVISTVAVAIGAAYVAAGWVAEFFGVSEAIAAALVALTAEGLMRWVIIASSDPLKVLREWRK